MKKYDLLLSILIILAVIFNSVYNHLDRKRSEKEISEMVSDFHKDVKWFNDKADMFVDKVEILNGKLRTFNKKYTK